MNLEFPGRQWTRSPVVLAQALIAMSKSALKAVTMIFMMFSRDIAADGRRPRVNGRLQAAKVVSGMGGRRGGTRRSPCGSSRTGVGQALGPVPAAWSKTSAEHKAETEQ